MSDLHVLLLMVLAGKTAFGVSVLFKYLVLRGSEVIRRPDQLGQEQWETWVVKDRCCQVEYVLISSAMHRSFVSVAIKWPVLRATLTAPSWSSLQNTFRLRESEPKKSTEAACFVWYEPRDPFGKPLKATNSFVHAGTHTRVLQLLWDIRVRIPTLTLEEDPAGNSFT